MFPKNHTGNADRNVFGTRLRHVREQRGMAQEKLGVLIGIDESASRARISRYETGVHEPPIGTARLLARALNVPLAYLYCDDDETADLLLKLAALPVAKKESGFVAIKRAITEIKTSSDEARFEEG